MTNITERVTSANITDLSIKSSLSKTFNKSAAPKCEELKEKIYNDLESKTKNCPVNSEEYNKLVALKIEFEQILNEKLPEGFELTPVLINPRLSNEDIRQTYKEFSANIKPEFIRYVAETNSEELKQHGASEHVISLMKVGYIDEDIFPYNVDHILERANSCVYSLEKSMDANNPRATSTCFKVNHFNNMILIPKKVHDLKNLIKKIQVEIYDDEYNARYLLMLTPKASNEKKCDLVCHPQAVTGKYGIQSISNYESILKTIGRLSKQSKNEIVGSKQGRQSLKDITREIRLKIEGSQKSINKRASDKYQLEKMLDDDNFKTMTKNLFSYHHPEINELKKSVEEAEKIINPQKNKKINKIFSFSR